MNPLCSKGRARSGVEAHRAGDRAPRWGKVCTGFARRSGPICCGRLLPLWLCWDGSCWETTLVPRSPALRVRSRSPEDCLACTAKLSASRPSCWSTSPQLRSAKTGATAVAAWPTHPPRRCGSSRPRSIISSEPVVIPPTHRVRSDLAVGAYLVDGRQARSRDGGQRYADTGLGLADARSRARAANSANDWPPSTSGTSAASATSFCRERQVGLTLAGGERVAHRGAASCRAP